MQAHERGRWRSITTVRHARRRLCTNCESGYEVGSVRTLILTADAKLEVKPPKTIDAKAWKTRASDDGSYRGTRSSKFAVAKRG